MVPARFAVAIHILLLLAVGEPEPGAAASAPATSFWLAERVNTNPVVVRRISGQLARAGLVRVRRGAGGAELSRPAASITLEDVWRAVSPEGRPLMALHAPATNGEAGERIGRMLAVAVREVEASFLEGLRRTTLESLAERARVA